jgi:hypothetical protein
LSRDKKENLMSQKTPVRKFHIWDKDRVYQGEFYGNDGGIPDTERWPYYEEIYPPDCPLAPCKPPEPEYPDGWYYTYHPRLPHQNPRLLYLEDGKFYDDQSLTIPEGPIQEYTLLASVGDVKFLDGRDEE